ncbi:histone-lysine N-methyltransferase PRDM9-like isoform X1, partial [Tachysurus ichikawai]
IYRAEQCEQYIDGRKEIHANWMRFVNCSCDNEEKNLVAFQYQGGIFYRCCRPIRPGQELLVWYTKEYAKNLSIAFGYIWKKKCSANVFQLGAVRQSTIHNPEDELRFLIGQLISVKELIST